jgi:hypothetical protein
MMRSPVDVGRTDTYLYRSGNPEAILRPDFPSGKLSPPDESGVTGHLKTAAVSETRRVLRLIAVLNFLLPFCETLGGEALT